VSETWHYDYGREVEIISKLMLKKGDVGEIKIYANFIEFNEFLRLFLALNLREKKSRKILMRGKS
jgi:hypothetical protein